MVTLLRRTPTERERWADEVLDRLSPAMTALGVLFLLVVLGESVAREGTSVAVALTVLGWGLWLVFVVEFVARLVVAPDTGRFLRRNVARHAGSGSGAVDVRVRNVGLTDAAGVSACGGETDIVFYPRAAGWSSMHRDDAEARNATKREASRTAL